MEQAVSAVTFAERLKLLAEAKGGASALAGAIGRSEGALRNWLTGRSEPTVSDVLALCGETGTRVEWLMIGQEPRRQSDINSVREDHGPYGVAIAFDEGLLKNIAIALERELAGVAVAPAKKAELIVSCYHFIGTAHKFDPAIVERLVKLVL